jgi:hypothetical protein
MRFAIDASDPRATNPDLVLLKEVKASPPLLRRPGVILLASSDPGRVEEKQR